jgi:hypothetical protein
MKELPTHECKNCSTTVEGEYCHFCGQRYHDHKESFGELVYEFTSDFLHFDSRFFKTILPLLFVPGKLTRSYNEGRQRSQFHPIRLYLFSSFIYFFLFFYFTNLEDRFQDDTISTHQGAFVIDSTKQIVHQDSLKTAMVLIPDSTDTTKITAIRQQVTRENGNKSFVTLKDSSLNYSLSVTSYMDSLFQQKVTSAQYQELQKKMKKADRAGYFERIITMRLLEINLKGEEGKKEFFKKLTETFLHNIPKMLFFLLPVFALFLKLLYRRKKQFYYVDHAVLSLHFFSLIFLLLTLSNFVLGKIFSTGIFNWLAFIWMTIYLLIAMKRLYGQKWGRTIFKFLVLGFLLLITVAITLVANMAWSAFMM